MVFIEIDDSDLEKEAQSMENLAERLPINLDIAMHAAADLIRDKLEEITPKRTGLTAISWTVIPLDRGEYLITNTNDPIATFLSEGTAPHEIFGNPLHWVDLDTGEDRFAMHVHHPGTQPLYLEDSAMLACEAEIQALEDAAIEAAERESYIE